MATVKELFTQIEQQLQVGGCDSPTFDTTCLLEDIGGIGRGQVQRSWDRVLPDAVCTAVLAAAKRRAVGEPLQYILGTWDFLSLTLSVGDGVLIPRPETEQLCELVAERLQGVAHPRVLDLCSGSGCIALGVASLCPEATVSAVEKSETAFSYLQRNLARYPSLAVTATRGDVLTDAAAFTDTVDAIVSNPPYIPSADLAALQREVQHEPKMALDGGEDGLVFYRAIAESWAPHLRSGGFVAVEIGIGEAEDVCRIFTEAGLTNVQIFRDFAGIERIIFANRA